MKHPFKKITSGLALLLIVFGLSGCGGESADAGLKSYDGGTFTINVNPDWQILTQSEFYSEIPKEAVVAFTEAETTDGFYNNVNIVQENLSADTGSIDFGRANINLASRNLTDYTKLDEAQIDLGGTSALVHIFDARLNPTENILHFVQLYTTKNRIGYTVTGAMPVETDQNTRDQIGAMVTSFRLK